MVDFNTCKPVQMFTGFTVINMAENNYSIMYLGIYACDAFPNENGPYTRYRYCTV